MEILRELHGQLPGASLPEESPELLCLASVNRLGPIGVFNFFLGCRVVEGDQSI